MNIITLKSRHTASERNLRYVFTMWMEDPTDRHRLERLKSVMLYWELKALIKRVTTSKAPTQHSKATT
jgi:hypothetical protein